MILTSVLAVIGGFAIYTLIWMANIKIINSNQDKFDSKAEGFMNIVMYIFIPITLMFFIMAMFTYLILGLTYPFWKTYELSEKIEKLEKKTKSKKRGS